MLETTNARKLGRRNFLRGAAALAGTGAAALMAAGPLGALQSGVAEGAPNGPVGYGPLVNKGDLWLPAAFSYQVISRQGMPMSDGQPTPGIFDGMGAYPGPGGNTVLIRNHENRERPGEQKVMTGALEYDPLTVGGNTKLEVKQTPDGKDAAGNQLFKFEVVNSFAILGGTSTNCAGGLRSPHTWITCEEVVKRSSNGKKHGYIFEIDSRSNGPVAAIPVLQAGRRAHEAAVEQAGIIYMTEDRGLTADTRLGTIGSCFYRYTPSPRGAGIPLANTSGPLEAMKLRNEVHANMDVGRVPGMAYPVEWVRVAEPDHNDDSDNRLDRAPGFTPNRVAAQDLGAAFFDRLEGMWEANGRIYFDATTGGPANLGQVWEYHPGREVVTLIYEGSDASKLQNPDNVVIVPKTGDIWVQEDGDAEQFVRGVTREGYIYDFARTAANDTEFCGGCFSPDGRTFFVNQQGDRGNLPSGPANAQAVTYAIWGPF